MKYLFWLVIFICACKDHHEIPMTIDHQIVDASDKDYGYYQAVKPTTGEIRACLLLLPGFGQKQEDVFLDTQLHQHASDAGILTIAFAGRTRMTADSIIAQKILKVLDHAKANYNIESDKLILGGFSMGGTIALRFAELCKAHPAKYQYDPIAVFMADSPVDLFFSNELLAENFKNAYSEISVREAEFVTKYYRLHYGATPLEAPERFKELSPFSIDKRLGENEQYLKDVAVRAYHDVDIAWRLTNRNQSARYDNFVATSELINRLLLLGNEKAEFIQTFRTGYRRNGDRHPHAWSIIDEASCIAWIDSLLGK